MRNARPIRDLLLFVALGACSSSTTGSDAAAPDVARRDVPDASDTPDVPAVEDVPVAPPDEGVPSSGIGDPCETETMLTQGTCRDGQICLDNTLGYRHGYCVAACLDRTSCPTDAICTQLQGFPVCLRRCSVNSECRTDDGYVCITGSTSGQHVCNVNDAPVGQRVGGLACYTTTAGPHMIPALARRTFTGANSSVSAARRDSRVNAEGNIAVHPMNGDVASSYIGIGGMGLVFMGVSFTSSAGSTWEWANVVDPLGSASDPVLDFGANGTVRMTFVGLARNSFGQVTRSSVRVTESTDFGRTWATPRAVEPANYCNQGGICDKPWIITGPGVTAGSESVYIGYMQNGRSATAQNINILVQRSDDGGMMWTPPTTIGRYASGTPTAPNLVQVATGRPGEIAAAWVGLTEGMGAGADGAVRFGSPGNHIYFRRSIDGFRTQDSLHVVSNSEHSPVYVQPPVAIDGDTVHVVFPSGDATAAWDLILATSTDNGGSWRYRKVNDEPDSCATHTFPALVVDHTTHDVHVLWMENRFGEGAVAYARCPASASMPCGTNEAVNDATFRFTTGRSPMSWHGDYLGLTLSPSGDLWATWSDTRTGLPQMYIAHGRSR